MYNQIISRVEGTLKTLGIDANEAKTGDGQYNIANEKNIEILIDVWEENQRVFFQAMSHVCALTNDTKPEVFKKILQENHGIIEASFALINNDLFIKETIECSAFFNQERALSSITRVAYYCELFKSKFPDVK